MWSERWKVNRTASGHQRSFPSNYISRGGECAHPRPMMAALGQKRSGDGCGEPRKKHASLRLRISSLRGAMAEAVASASSPAAKALHDTAFELDARRDALRKLHAAELAALTTRHKEATRAFETEAGAKLQALQSAVSSAVEVTEAEHQPAIAAAEAAADMIATTLELKECGFCGKHFSASEMPKNTRTAGGDVHCGACPMAHCPGCGVGHLVPVSKCACGADVFTCEGCAMVTCDGDHGFCEDCENDVKKCSCGFCNMCTDYCCKGHSMGYCGC